MIGFAALIQILNVLIVYSLARGLGVEVSFLHCLVLVPPVLFLSMMPISFAAGGCPRGRDGGSSGSGFGAVGPELWQSRFPTDRASGGKRPGGVLWLIKRRRQQAGTVIQARITVEPCALLLRLARKVKLGPSE